MPRLHSIFTVDSDEKEGSRWLVTKKYTGSIIGADVGLYPEIEVALETDPSLSAYKPYMVGKPTMYVYDVNGNWSIAEKQEWGLPRFSAVK